MNVNHVSGHGFRDVTASELQTVEGGIWALVGRAVFAAATFLARQGLGRASHNGSSEDGPTCPVD